MVCRFPFPQTYPAATSCIELLFRSFAPDKGLRPAHTIFNDRSVREYSRSLTVFHRALALSLMFNRTVGSQPAFSAGVSNALGKETPGVSPGEVSIASEPARGTRKFGS